MAEELNLEEAINQRFNSDSFEPFAVTLTSGERLEIDNQMQLAMGKYAMTLYRPRSGFTMFRKNQLVALHVS